MKGKKNPPHKTLRDEFGRRKVGITIGYATRKRGTEEKK